MSQAGPLQRAASFAVCRTPSSRPVSHGAAALVLVFVTACAADLPTDPTGATPARSDAIHALTGATSTPIFPTAGPDEIQIRGDARGLNASGQITGAEFDLEIVNDFKPFRWTSGTGASMLVGCCDTEWGADLNDAGVVVGTTQQSLVIGTRAFVASGTTMQILPILAGADAELNASAVAVNNAGQIVGSSPGAGFASVRHAVLWDASRMIRDLGTLGGTNSAAIDINDAGQVIGSSQIAGDAATHFFLWSAATGMQDLNAVISPALTSVVEINEAGQITGTYTAASGHSHAFLYTPGRGLRDLGTLGGAMSAPTGLNDNGQVVGSSTTAGGATHAFLWTPADGMADITAITGITDVGRLNDNLQTVSGYVAPSAPVNLAKAGVPRLVQLELTANR